MCRPVCTVMYNKRCKKGEGFCHDVKILDIMVKIMDKIDKK